jgi:SPP1 phage holin
VRFTIAVLAAIKVFLGTFGYNFFNDEQWIALENLIPFGFIIYGMWKNNYLSKKGEEQKAILKRHGAE